MLRMFTNCCCCRNFLSVKEEQVNLVIESSHGIPCTLSTHNVNGLVAINSKNVPFAIPSSTRKTTPVPSHATDPSDDDSSLHSPVRSRTSTVEYFNNELGELEPNLYIGYDSDDATTYPSDHLGRLWYTLAYDMEDEQLTVSIIKAKNLPTGCKKDCNRESSVRISLVPDEKRYLQSQIKTSQENPLFNETFKFPLASGLVQERCVQFSLYQSEAGRRAEVKGQAMVQLDESLLADENGTEATKCWVDFDSRRASQQMVKRYQKGKILLSLQYDQHKQRLFVVVFRCIRVQHHFPTDVVLKVELSTVTNNNKRVRRKKGQTVQMSSDELNFNELFKFSISEDCLQSSSVCIIIKPSKPTDKHSGQCWRTMLGGMMLAAGRELQHWQTMIGQPNEEHIQWHDLC